MSIVLVVILAMGTIGCEASYATKKRLTKLPKVPSIIESEDGVIANKGTYDFRKMKEDLKALEGRFPDKMSYSSIGKSIEGRELYAVKIGKGENKILLVGSVHAREWMTSYLLMGLLELYLESEEQGKRVGGYNIKKMLKNTTITFVPMLNPDGVDLVLNGVGHRDKEELLKMNDQETDFTRWKANIAGVDLNRQFNADWEKTQSKEGPSFENYKGEKYLDQPESAALVRLTQEEDFDITVAYHLSGSVIFWYYHQKNSTYKRDLGIAKGLRWITGYKLVEEEDSEGAAAGFKDWFVKTYEKPGYTIEIGDKRYDAIQEKDLPRFIKENRRVVPYLAKAAKKIK